MVPDVHSPALARRRLIAGLLIAVLAEGCGDASRSPGATPDPTQSAPASTPTSTNDPEALDGTWVGELRDPTTAYPVRLAFDDCTGPGTTCGDLEYEDPASGSVLCASELTLTSVEGGRFAFDEAIVYHPWMCLATTFRMVFTGSGSLEVEQLVDGAVCCQGQLERLEGPAPTPLLPVVDGLGSTTSRVALGGATTQYSTSLAGSLWFPVEDAGTVVRVDGTTGDVVASIDVGDPGAVDGLRSDPHSVVAGEAGIWVAQAAAKAVGRIDPDSDAVVKSITVGVVPYALALDGTTLWVASFDGDAVVPVDLEAGSAGTMIAVSKPTGIAVGLGAVWVVQHRNDSVVRIDPISSAIVATIRLGDRGPHALCGMCVENVVVADGAVWTANNVGRSVGRIDPATNSAVTIELPLRTWAVAAGGGSIWASQYAASNDDRPIDLETWGVARINPITSVATVFDYPGAFGVAWAEGALWVAAPTRRGDEVARIAIVP
ncbi:MAG: hypothetical protein AB1736_00620 [Chloroflexota bacterium]